MIGLGSDKKTEIEIVKHQTLIVGHQLTKNERSAMSIPATRKPDGGEEIQYACNKPDWNDQGWAPKPIKH